jgi:hypothetical protein
MSNFLAANAVGAARKSLGADVAPAKAAPVLSMYSELPEGEIAIEEFERFAMDRLRGGCCMGVRQRLP